MAPSTWGSQAYAGEWVFKYVGKNFMVLNLKFVKGHYTGVMTMPKHFQMGQGGSITGITPSLDTESVASATITKGHLQITTRSKDGKDENQFLMTLVDDDHATLGIVGIPLAPWKLVRVSDSDEATVATDWPADGPRIVSPEISALQLKLKEMADEDQAVRKAKPISDSRVKQMDDRHYPELVRILGKYGWPAISLVGKEAAGEYWLLVQHQDDHLEFQKRVLALTRRATDTGEASKVDYAYLYDRVTTNEGKPQHWGTQTTCKNGKPVLDPVDDPAGLEQRRSELQLMPLDKYLKMLAPDCADAPSHARTRHD